MAKKRKKKSTGSRIDTFALQPGRKIGKGYVVDSRLGSGWEGEVYRVVEQRTGAFRAAKLFFPQRNLNDRALDFYATKLENLSVCPLLIRYHHLESMRFRGQEVTVLISEYVEGKILSNLIEQQRGKRLPEFEALHLLYALISGLEEIHLLGDYHGDLHTDNLIVQRRGVHYEVKVVDLLDLGRPTKAKIKKDVVDSVRILYDMLGGQPRYRRQRPEIKHIIAGLKQSLIEKRFPTAGALREHLDVFDWNE